MTFLIETEEGKGTRPALKRWGKLSRGKKEGPLGEGEAKSFGAPLKTNVKEGGGACLKSSREKGRLHQKPCERKKRKGHSRVHDLDNLKTAAANKIPSRPSSEPKTPPQKGTLRKRR